MSHAAANPTVQVLGGLRLALDSLALAKHHLQSLASKIYGATRQIHGLEVDELRAGVENIHAVLKHLSDHVDLALKSGFTRSVMPCACSACVVSEG